MALITTPLELQKYLPSSVYDDMETLVVLTERAERKHLVPVLGQKLYDHICQQYAELMDEYGEVPSTVPDDSPSGDVLPLLKLCQSAVAYFTVADNAGQLSLSFNMGNGLAQVNTEGYTAPNEETFKRFIKDVWHQATQDIDDICTMLEGCSRSGSDSTVAALWQDSDWFYFQGDLLLTTAREAKRYVNADEQPFSYKEFVEWQGEMRARQEANIAPQMGEELFDALVKSQYSPLSPALSTEEERESVDMEIWKSVLKHLRMALMSYIRFSRTNLPKHENDALLFMSRAAETVRKHQSDFLPYVKTSPLYQPTQEELEANKHEVVETNIAYGETGDSIFNPFG